MHERSGSWNFGKKVFLKPLNLKNLILKPREENTGAMCLNIWKFLKNLGEANQMIEAMLVMKTVENSDRQYLMIEVM